MQVLSGLGQQLRSTIAGMSRRKGEDTTEKKRRRMPFVAKIKREDPFRSADQREISAMCRRVAAASEYCAFSEQEKSGEFRVYHFTTWAKARAMQHWIDRSGIAKRPMPKLGLTKEEKETERRELMAWATGTGALRQIVQAYRQRIFAGDGPISASIEAYRVANELGCKKDGQVPAVDYLVEWARKNHTEWFVRCQPAEEPAPAPKPAVRLVKPQRSAPPAPEPPRWRPTF